ncbi:hypothetical protein EVAR_83870_1 [Eumeta japonica]|uniref:Uncharacterized protein n=1 Tax=Eumeta variegata TaxID=151549 RepID=A0A4C1UR86_EUMVA|nr:hypothetical protein EVAR_83870_1 [Eumeta japonica]
MIMEMNPESMFSFARRGARWRRLAYELLTRPPRAPAFQRRSVTGLVTVAVATVVNSARPAPGRRVPV